MAGNYFGAEVLVGSLFMDRQVRSIRCIDQEVKYTRGRIPLLESTMDERTVIGLESMDHEYNAPTSDTPAKKLEYYPDILRHKVPFCIHITLTPFTQVWVKAVTKTSGLIHLKPKKSLWTGRRNLSVSEIHEVVANKAFEVSLTSSPLLERIT